MVFMSTVSTSPQETIAVEQIQALQREYLLQNYARYPLVLQKGKGCYVYDLDGKRYLDLIAGIGVNALGYAHPRMVKVIREQAGLLVHTSNLYYHEYQGRLAERLAKISGLNRTFFTNSGTESMEGAIKMMRSHGRKISPAKYPSTAAAWARFPSPARRNTAAISSRCCLAPNSFP